MITTRHQAYASLICQICPACGKAKRSRMSFCGGCYRALPRPMKNALYSKIGDGYEPAFDDAMVFLGVEDPKFPPSAGS